MGAPVEFLSWPDIRRQFGPDGVVDFEPEFGGRGMATDDTQMTLFTLEVLIRAHVRERITGRGDVVTAVHGAYLRWLRTQLPSLATAGQDPRSDGWLIANSALHHRRAPGHTCVTALQHTASGQRLGSTDNRLNDSKGNGGAMRAAPVALWSSDAREVFDLAAATAALTHGHPSGFFSAAALAVIVHQLLHGAELPAAIDVALRLLRDRTESHEVSAALADGMALAAEGRPSPQVLTDRLGYGAVGEQALAIAVCVALVADDLVDGLRLAVNHSGDSDSTGAICGNILGARYGVQAVPGRWVEQLELRDVIERITMDAFLEFGYSPPVSESWLARYPAN